VVEKEDSAEHFIVVPGDKEKEKEAKETFPFQDQLKSMMEMGFEEKQSKALLVKNNGNIQEALRELMS